MVIGQIALRYPFPVEALPLLVDQLMRHGAEVRFDDETSGLCSHVSGKIRFRHDAGVLHMEVFDQAGHFPPRMIVGGIRQAVEEAKELYELKEGLKNATVTV